MLISAASPDIRNREKELGLDADRRECADPAQVQKQNTDGTFMSARVSRNQSFLSLFLCFPWKDTETGEDSERWISRKEKSLGLLCHKFLARYPDYPNPTKNNDICLDDVATELSMSSVQNPCRIAKNASCSHRFICLLPQMWSAGASTTS